MRPKKKSPQDEEFKKNIAQLIKSYESGRSTKTLRRLGEFLSTPIGLAEICGYAPGVRYSSPEVDSTAGGIADFLATILRKLVIPY